MHGVSGLMTARCSRLLIIDPSRQIAHAAEEKIVLNFRPVFDVGRTVLIAYWNGSYSILSSQFISDAVFHKTAGTCNLYVVARILRQPADNERFHSIEPFSPVHQGN